MVEVPVSSPLHWQASHQCVISLENIVQMWLIFNKLLSAHCVLVSIPNSVMCLQVPLPTLKDLIVQKASNICLIGHSEEEAKTLIHRPESVMFAPHCSLISFLVIPFSSNSAIWYYWLLTKQDQAGKHYKSRLWFVSVSKVHLGNKSHQRLETMWARVLDMIETNMLKPQNLCWGNWSAFQLPNCESQATKDIAT